MKTDPGRKLYSLKEIYWIVYHAMRTVRCFSRAKRNDGLTTEFAERIMLAVTEVNGCALCSYAHARIALEAGLRNEEIQNMLAGDMADIPTEELPAVLFAQHYAQSRGEPAHETWDRIVEIYGLLRAYGILGAIRMITMGNAFGIPFGSFLNRFKGKPDKRSNILYELRVMIFGTLLMPIAMIHALLAGLFRAPVIAFKKAGLQ